MLQVSSPWHVAIQRKEFCGGGDEKLSLPRRGGVSPWGHDDHRRGGRHPSWSFFFISSLHSHASLPNLGLGMTRLHSSNGHLFLDYLKEDLKIKRKELKLGNDSRQCQILSNPHLIKGIRREMNKKAKGESSQKWGFIIDVSRPFLILQD